MKILVTGGAGFIGSAIIPVFKDRGFEISVIDDLSFGKREFINIDDENFFQIDIRNREAIINAVKRIDPDVVIHLAAVHFIPYCNEHPFESAAAGCFFGNAVDLL